MLFGAALDTPQVPNSGKAGEGGDTGCDDPRIV